MTQNKLSFTFRWVLRLSGIVFGLFIGLAPHVAHAAIGRTFYVDFAKGADWNAGTTQSTPWKHAPGMHGAIAWPAITVPQPGDRIIFKGGVTWDHSAFEWDIPWKGTAAQPIYIGVDPTWFAGSTWSRPVFSGDHQALGSGDSLISVGDYSVPHVDNYIILDNIELKGLKAFSNIWPASISHNCATYFVMQNLYIHDWELDSSIPTDDAHGGVIGNYPGCRPTGTKLTHSEISNAEARDAGRQNGIAVRSTDIEFSVIHDVQTAQLFGLAHDSEFFNISYPALGRGVPGSNMGFDPTPYHENVTYIQGWDGVGLPEIRPGLIYNNVIHDIYSGSGAIYPNGCPATPFIIFNNLVYNDFGNQALLIDQYGGSGTCGEYHVWNNILEIPETLNMGPMRQVERGLPIQLLDIQNNRLIFDRGPALEYSPGAVSFVQSGNVLETNAGANDEGRSAFNSFGFVVADYVPIFDMMGSAAGTNTDPALTGFSHWEFVGDRFLP